jgi:hypothetical protein
LCYNSLSRHATAQHSTAQHSTAQHSTAQHSTAQHSTAQHSTPYTSTAASSGRAAATTHAPAVRQQQPHTVQFGKACSRKHAHAQSKADASLGNAQLPPQHQAPSLCTASMPTWRVQLRMLMQRPPHASACVPWAAAAHTAPHAVANEHAQAAHTLSAAHGAGASPLPPKTTLSCVSCGAAARSCRTAPHSHVMHGHDGARTARPVVAATQRPPCRPRAHAPTQAEPARQAARVRRATRHATQGAHQPPRRGCLLGREPWCAQTHTRSSVACERHISRRALHRSLRISLVVAVPVHGQTARRAAGPRHKKSHACMPANTRPHTLTVACPATHRPGTSTNAQAKRGPQNRHFHVMPGGAKTHPTERKRKHHHTHARLRHDSSSPAHH